MTENQHSTRYPRPHTCGWRRRDTNRHAEIAETRGAYPLPRGLFPLGDFHVHTTNATAACAGDGAVEVTIPTYEAVANAAATRVTVALVLPVSVLCVVAGNADAAADAAHAAAALGAVAIRQRCRVHQNVLQTDISVADPCITMAIHDQSQGISLAVVARTGNERRSTGEEVAM